MTSAGIPVVYYGEEVGRMGGEWPDNRSDMPWGARKILPGRGLPRDEALREEYRRLIGIRRSHRALSRGAHSGKGVRDLLSGESAAVKDGSVETSVPAMDARILAVE